MPLENKKIAFVISSLSSGGAERVVSSLSNYLIDYYSVSIIVLYKCEPFYTLDTRINVVFCNDYYKPISNPFKSLFNHFKLTQAIHNHLNKLKIDLAIGFMTTTNIYTILACQFKKIPCLVSERIHPEYDIINPKWKAIRKRIYPLANHIIVQTESIKKHFAAFLNPRQLIIIKNPISPEILEKINKNTTRENLIINVGRFTDQKNQESLIKAFHNINSSNWKLHLIGSGENQKKYEELIIELNLQAQVKIIGNVNDLSDYYNKASVFAFTSLFEGFPNALTEAMVYGIACLSTNCPSGPSELITNNQNGLLIPVNNQTELEIALERLILNKSLREELGLNAKKCIVDFEIETIGHQWRNLINQYLS